MPDVRDTERLSAIIDAAVAFLNEPEVREAFEDMKSSNSAALPVEFMALGHSIEDAGLLSAPSPTVGEAPK